MGVNKFYKGTMIKILAIDDNQDNLISLKALIKEAFPSAKLFTAHNGEIGLEVARAEDPDLILLDIIIPGMDGFEVCQNLKADITLCDIPVVFVTALKGDKENRIRALECGAEAFLAKPIDESELTAQIRAMVKIRSANLEKRNEKDRLAALVEEQTRELKKAYKTTLNLLDDLKNENEALKKTEEALIESQLLLKSSMESLKDTIVLSINQQYHYLYFNPFHKGVMRSVYGKEVKLGMNLLDCITNEDDKIKAKNNYDRTLKGESHTTIEEYGDLERYFYETRYNPIINDKNEVIGATAFSSNITERMQAEKKLRESEERFKHIFESANVGKSITMPTGEINVNQAFCDMLGYSKEELKNKKWQDITTIDDIESTQNIINSLLKGEKNSARFNKRYIHNNGTFVWADVSVVILRDQQGKPLHFITTVIDINEQVKAENALLESEETTRTLLNGLPESAFLMELDGTLIAANNTVAERLGKTVGELIGKNVYQTVLPEVAERRRNFANQVVETKQPVQFEDERFGKTIDNRIHPIFDQQGNVIQFAIIGIDITERKMTEERIRESEMRSRSTFDQSPVGSVIVGLDKRFIKCNAAFCHFLGYTEDELIGKTISEVTYTEDIELGMLDMKLLVEGKKESSTLQKRYLRKDGAIVWGDVSISLVRDAYNKPMYFLPVIQNITERKQVEDELKKSETLYRKMNENSPLGMHFYKLNKDNHLIFVEANPAANKLLGVDHSQFIGKKIEEAFPALAQTEVHERYRNAAEKGNSWETEQIIYDDGKISGAFEVRAFQTSPGNMVAVFADITNRKKSEEALRESELKYRSLIENTSDVVFCVNERGEYQFTNKVFASTFGKTPDYFVGKTFWDIYPKEEADFRFAATKRVFETGLTQSVEVSVPLPDKTLHFIAKANPIKDDTGKVILNLTSAIDITERKEAEEKIRESETMLRNSQQLAKIGSFHHNVKTDQAYWSDELFVLYGLVPENKLMSLSVARSFLHPDDINKVDEMIKKALETDEAIEVEYRIIRADGLVRDHFAITRITIDENNEMIAIEGTVQDITERKLDEEAVKKSEAQYRLLAYHMTDTVWMMDMNLTTTYISPSVEKLRGYTLEEIQQLPLEEQLAPESYQIAIAAFSEEMNKILSDPTYFTSRVIELEFYRKDGTSYWSDNTFTLIRDKEGNPVSFLGEGRDITERKKAEEALRKSEEKYRTIFENVQDVFYQTDMTGIVLEISPSINYYTDFSRDEIVGFPATNLYYNPNDRVTILNELMKKGEIRDFQLKIKTKTYQIKYASINARLIFGSDGKPHHIDGAIRDITERKLAEKQIQQLSRAIEQSTVSVVITNKEGEIEYTNPKVIELTGYSFDELKGKNPRILKSGEHPAEFYEALWNTILSGNDWHGEFHNKKKNGELYWESAIISPIINENGDITNFIAIKEDITEGKKIIRELITAKEKAEESDRLKSAFLANMSHEIRTPMNSIMGFASLLPEEESKDLIASYSSIIVQNSEQLVHIIDDIVLYSRLQTKLLSLVSSPFNVQNLLTDVKQSFNLPEYQKGVELIIKTDSEIPVWVRSDYEKVRQLFANLISNAFKYTKEGTITIGFTSEDEDLEFFVKDTGIGIPTEELDKVFDRFYRGSNVNKGAIGGTGLGLSIVKELAKLLGGKIWVESEIYKGSTFYFTITDASNLQPHFIEKDLKS